VLDPTLAPGARGSPGYRSSFHKEARVSRSDDQAFRGTIGKFHRDSTAWWPEPQRAAKGTPSVLLIVLAPSGTLLGTFADRA
jgi:hypothetical protein